MGKMTEIHAKNRKVKIRSDGSVQVIQDNGKETKTDQSFKDIQNVNSIMKKYSQLGYSYINLPEAVKGTYGDFTKTKDYQSALDQSIKVQNAFMQLPSAIRKRFYNDPQKLADFMKDAKNIDEAITLGLVKKPTTVETPPITPIPPKAEK